MPRGIYERTPENTTRYWLGKKRGSLSEETKKKQSQSLKGRKMSIEARKKISKSSLGKKGTYGHLGHKHSIEARKKMGARKEKHPNWKGGITPINEVIRSSTEYKLWREKVFERDNYTCVQCGIHSGLGKRVVMNADHIKPFSLFPELRFSIKNGRTLCEMCHRKTDTFVNRIYNYKHKLSMQQTI